MPAATIPSEGDIGVLINGIMVPASQPLSYIPAKGEVGIDAGGIFLPIEPIYNAPKNGDEPLLRIAQPIDREPPWIDQVDMRVATPCVSPYNWQAATADRTIILDTTPDASASAEEKALPGYVANPGLSLSSRTHRDFDLTAFDEDDGVAYLWTYGSSPATPHPALRTGQTRYSGISGAAVGTAYDGTPFLPGSGATLINGTLKISAYRHGLLLSDVGSYGVKVKIGRGTATWDADAQTLTLATDTSGTTIKYSTDGSAPTTTYTTPISITDTATVRWYATKASMVDSTEWQTAITYSDAAPPADFSTVYFSSLPAFSNSPVNVAIQFQQKPDFYITPSGTGDGLTPSTPSNATTVIGLTTAAGLATGARSIATAKSGTAALQLTRGGVNPSGSAMKYSLDNSTWTTYSAPVDHTAPGRIWFKLERSGGAAFSPTWFRPWFIGTGAGVQINAVWSLAGQTLTLTYEPTPLVDSDVRILYSLDGSAPSLVYSGPITITADCTPKVKAIHPVDTGTPSDFATSTGVYDCTTIDIDATADYDEDHAATWTADATVAAYTFSRPGDLVWCAEGTYTNPTGTASTYFRNTEAIVIRGGYSSDFTERDVANRKSIFDAVTWSSGTAINSYVLLVSAGILDGLFGDSEYTTAGAYAQMLYAATLYNCHVVIDEALSVAKANLNCLYAGKLIACSTDISLTTIDGAAGTAGTPTGGESSIAIAISSQSSPYPKCIDCNFSAVASPGNGGAGYSSANGGKSSATISVIQGGGARNTTNFIATAGIGGNGGSSGGWGGDSLATVSIGRDVSNGTELCISNLEAYSSNAGSGGSGGYAGQTKATISLPMSLNCSVTLAGSCGSVGRVKEATATIDTIDNGGITNCDIDAALDAGSSGSAYLYITTGATKGCYKIKISGSLYGGGYCGLRFPLIPTYFESGDLAYTETGNLYYVNPLRVNAVSPATAGWYSGTVNSDGAPAALCGGAYSTPRGTGVALGKYWE